MEDSLRQGRRIAAGVEAVQCAIAIVDAITVSFLGEVSAGPSHEDAVALLARSGAPAAAARVEGLRRILEMKYLMEYDDRAPTDAEARDLAERVRRLHRWATDSLRAPK